MSKLLQNNFISHVTTT